MRIHLIKITAILFCCVAFAASAKAQSGSVFKIEIPFDFFIYGKNFPAGEYQFSRLNPTNPDILIIKNTARKKKAIFLTQRLKALSANKPSGLTFLRFGNIYFLNSIWALGDMFANQMIYDESIRKKREASESQLVLLTVK
jgi:hypothetical protein